MYKITRGGEVAVLICTAILLAAPAPAATVAKTTTFAPGFFWTHFTYAYTVTPAPGDCPCDDFEVTFNSLVNIDKSTYSGPGSVAAAPPPPPANVMRVNMPANLTGAPFTFSIQSITNPTVVEGRETFDLTLSGVSVATSTVALGVPPPPSIPRPGTGATVVTFAAGTFSPSDQVDLFQSTTTGTAQIGFGSALANGSAVITLARPLTSADLLIGDAAAGASTSTIVFAFAAVPEPGTAALLAIPLLLAACIRRKKA